MYKKQSRRFSCGLLAVCIDAFSCTCSSTAEEKTAFCEEKIKTYQELLKGLTAENLSDEILETLLELRRLGYLLAIGSSSKNTKFILNRRGLEHFFDAISRW